MKKKLTLRYTKRYKHRHQRRWLNPNRRVHLAELLMITEPKTFRSYFLNLFTAQPSIIVSDVSRIGTKILEYGTGGELSPVELKEQAYIWRNPETYTEEVLEVQDNLIRLANAETAFTKGDVMTTMRWLANISEMNYKFRIKDITVDILTVEGSMPKKGDKITLLYSTFEDEKITN